MLSTMAWPEASPAKRAAVELDLRVLGSMSARAPQRWRLVTAQTKELNLVSAEVQ